MRSTVEIPRFALKRLLLAVALAPLTFAPQALRAEETLACNSGEYVISTSITTPIRHKQEREFSDTDRTLKVARSGRRVSLFSVSGRSDTPKAKLLIDRKSLTERPCIDLKKQYRDRQRQARSRKVAPLVRRAHCSCNAVLTATKVPNDPYYGILWGMTKINAPQAWDTQTDATAAVVAIIDSGVDYNHPDLALNMWKNPGEIAGNNRDDDGNGVTDDVFGMNSAADSGNPMDENGHGTHVAGTIGARGNNGVGVAGVAWNVKIMAVRFLGTNNTGDLFSAIEAIDYVTTMKNRGVPVVASNNSWGGVRLYSPLRDAIVRAQSAGILFVAAAGNSSANVDQSPATPACETVDNIVAVAAIDSNSALAYYSNFGSNCVDVAAPGSNIYSTLP